MKLNRCGCGKIPAIQTYHDYEGSEVISCLGVRTECECDNGKDTEIQLTVNDAEMIWNHCNDGWVHCKIKLPDLDEMKHLKIKQQDGTYRHGWGYVTNHNFAAPNPDYYRDEALAWQYWEVIHLHVTEITQGFLDGPRKVGDINYIEWRDMSPLTEEG